MVMHWQNLMVWIEAATKGECKGSGRSSANGMEFSNAIARLFELAGSLRAKGLSWDDIKEALELVRLTLVTQDSIWNGGIGP